MPIFQQKYMLLHHCDCKCKFVSCQLCPPWLLHSAFLDLPLVIGAIRKRIQPKLLCCCSFAIYVGTSGNGFHNVKSCNDLCEDKPCVYCMFAGHWGSMGDSECRIVAVWSRTSAQTCTRSVPNPAVVHLLPVSVHGRMK